MYVCMCTHICIPIIACILILKVQKESIFFQIYNPAKYQSESEIFFSLTQKEGISKSTEITTKWIRLVFGIGLCENEGILPNEALWSEKSHNLDICVDACLVIEDCCALFFSGIDGKRT